MTIFVCDDNFDAMMTCIYDAWSSRLGHANVKLKAEPIGNYELFCDYKHIETDEKKAQSVISSIQHKISYQAYTMIFKAAMSTAEDKLDAIYRFVIAGFHYGSHVIDYLQEPTVMRIFELSRKVGNEAHFFREFVRFSNMDHNVLVSHIEPKSNILTMIAHHFCDRLPSENWMIIDDTRNLALVHPADLDFYLTTLSASELRELSKESQDPFIDLWKGFFEHISIKERTNKRCQRNMLPIWYRKHLTEFK